MKEILKHGKKTLIEEGWSKQKYFLDYNGEKYILQICPNKKTADLYVSFYRRLVKYDIFPKLLYQEGRKLIWEYIGGRDCNKEDASKVAYQVGKICAYVNKIKMYKKYDLDKRFMQNLNALFKVESLTKGEYSKIKNLYSELKKKIKIKTAMDANDVYPENFRFAKNGKVYFVDIEAIKPIVKGQGIAKAFNRWFRTPSQRAKFKKGYSSISSIKFLTEDYFNFINLFFLVRSNGIKTILKQEINKNDLLKLKEMVR